MINKSVLLIAPQYFGYDVLIAKFMRDMGVDVDLLPDRPLNSNAGKAVMRLNRNLAMPFADRYFKDKISNFGRKSYDAILVIQGEGVSPMLLSWIRSVYPTTPLTWYLWDSFENKPALHENLPYFDAVFSFDHKDSKDYGMALQPLFFSPTWAQIVHAERKFDLCFIGTGHEDRFPLVRSLKHAHQDKCFFSFLFLPSPMLYAWRRLSDRNLRGSTAGDFSFGKMTQAEVQNIVAQSEVVLDVQHPAQRGLTMRTVETMGARKKLITTNPSVRQYDFYNENNILVIDRKNPVIPESFFQAEYSPLDPSVVEKYTVLGFLRALLGLGFFNEKSIAIQSDILRRESKISRHAYATS